MNRFFFNISAADATHSVGICKLFTLINTMGSNVFFNTSSSSGTDINSVEVDFPFDDPLPELAAISSKYVDNSEITSSPDLRLFPYVTLGSVIGIASKDEVPEADLSRFYCYKIETSLDSLKIYVGIANSALTESYAPFGIREGVKPSGIEAMIVTSENALQNMLNACACPPRNPSTGLSASDLSATYRP